MANHAYIRSNRGPASGSDLRFDGRVVIVTGAGRGLGRDYARLLGERGAAVVVNDLGCSAFGDGTSDEPARRVVEEIEASGGVAIANGGSVATPAGADGIVQSAIEAFGRVDVMVHSAGIVHRGTVEDIGAESLAKVMDAHLNGAFYLARAAWPHMKAAQHGRIVFTTSAAGLYGMEANAAYSAAKAGLLGLTRSLALDGHPDGIHVNAISPAGHTRLGYAAESGQSGDGTESAGDEVLADTMGSRALAAAVVSWLSHESCRVNGVILSAAGRRIARVLVSETLGSSHGAVSTEDVAMAWTQIDDEHGAIAIADLAHWMELSGLPTTLLQDDHGAKTDDD